MRGLIDGLGNPHPMLAAMPAVYHEDDFSRRLTRVFDDALAPVVSTLDNLEAYADPTLAPRDYVEWLAVWLGFPIGETWPEDRARELLTRAVELYQWSGTVKGLKLLLEAYAGVEPEVVDNGGVSWSTVSGADASTGGKQQNRGKAGATKSKGGPKGVVISADNPPDEHAEPHVRVTVPIRRRKEPGGVDRRQLEALINATRPAHVSYTLEVRG